MKFEIKKDGQLIDVKDLPDGSHKIGRTPDCPIQLASPQVSKQHALLVVKDNKAAIVDLGSANGVFVNGILVRKQRIERNDEISIGSFRIRISNSKTKRPIRPSTAIDGNLAKNLDMDSAPEEAPAAQLTPQEKLLLLVDTKILDPYYRLVKSFDWRFILAGILLGALVLSVILSVIPVVRWGHTTTTRESLARAQTILGQVVRENYRILAKTNDFTRLTVESAEAESGILSCYVLDPRANTILAPTKLFNKSVTDVYALLAIKKITEQKQEFVSVDRGGGEYIVGLPIYLYSQETNDRSLAAIVLADFQIPDQVTATFEPLVEAALFSILLSLAAYYLIFKMFQHPISKMQEQLDVALKGEEVTITSEAKSSELEGLAAVINFALSRMRLAGGNAPIKRDDPETEDKEFERAVQEFDKGTSDALLLLDKDKKVVFVGQVLEELLGMRNQYAVGQNISDACRDQSFAGTVIDMSDKVVQTLGEPQFSTLDVNGISRNLVAIGHKNQQGEIRFVFVTVKLSG